MNTMDGDKGRSCACRYVDVIEWRPIVFGVILLIGLMQKGWAGPLEVAGEQRGSAAVSPEVILQAKDRSLQKPEPDHAGVGNSAPYIRDFSKPYNEYVWVTAHNGYLNDLDEQLERGVRGLMWDVHPFRLGAYPDYWTEAYLCHETLGGYEESPCAPASKTRKPFKDELQKVMRFLDKEENKSAVVTILLQDRVERRFIEEAFASVPGLSDYVFDVRDYIRDDHWPTLQQIIDSHKRIIFFVENLNGEYPTPAKPVYLAKGSNFKVENTYDLGSTTSDNWECVTRWSDIPLTTPYASEVGFTSWPRLFTLNQFHTLFSSPAHAAQIDNNLTWLEHRIDRACAVANEKRLIPNFLALDYSQVGDAVAYAGALTEGGVYFYEDNNGVSEAHPDSTLHAGPTSALNSDVVCVLPTSVEWDIRLKAAGCENDETRSLALRGVKKGTSIKVFDQPNASKSDDYIVINVLRDIGLSERVVVGSYERSYTNADVEVTYHPHNGLDGKVSHIIIEPETGSIMPKIKLADDSDNDVCSVPVDAAISFELGGNGDAYGCSNDDAQSFVLTGALAGSTITLFGTKDASETCSQGCVRLFVRKDMTAPFSIANLDRFGASTESADGSVLAVRYGGDQQLAGKVSYMKVSLDSFTGQDVVPTSAEADGSFGSWGAKAQCPVGRFAWGFSLKIEKNQGSGDNTGLNSVRMFCSEDAQSNPIESAGGSWGGWSATYKCAPSNGPLKGFAMRTLWPRDHSDEVVATDLIGICQDGTRIGGAMPEDWGVWSSDFICPADLYAAGFITRLEGYQAEGDDTALNGMRMYCARSFDEVLPTKPVIQQVTPGTSVIYWDDSVNQDGIAEFEISGDGRVLGSTHTNFYEFNTQGISEVSVVAVDFDGNRSAPSSVAVPAFDATPPATPTGLKVVNHQDGLFEISWDEIAGSASSLAYEISYDGQVQGVTPETSIAIDEAVTPLNFMLAVRAHKFNDTYSAPVSLFIDRTPPQSPSDLSFSDLQSHSLKLSWAASSDETKMKGYAVYRDGSLLAETAGTTFTVKGLEIGVNYTFAVQARDAADNQSAVVSVFVDREAPSTPRDIEYSDVTPTSLKLSWLLSHDNVGVVGYRVVRDDGATFDTKTPDYHDTTLKPLTTYRYSVSAYDANLNPSQPTTLLVDREPPSAPSGARYSEDTGTTLLIQWTASTDDVGVTGYHIYRDDLPEAIGETDLTTFTASGLTPATTYTFHLEAFDAAGNQSARALLLVDRVAPVLAPFFYAYGANGAETDTPLLKWEDATDDTGVAGYELSVDGNVVQTASERPVKTADLGLSTGENHTFGLRAYDAAGNHSAPEELVMYHGRPSMPIDLKGTLMPGGGVIFDWDRGDPSTTRYSIQTDAGVETEQPDVRFPTLVNEALDPPSVAVKLEAINSEGAKSLSIFCKKTDPATPTFDRCEPSDYTNTRHTLNVKLSRP